MDCTLEKTAAPSSSKIRQVSDTLGIFAYWQDLDGVYLDCNQAFQNLLTKTGLPNIAGLKDTDLPWVKKYYPKDIDEVKKSPPVVARETILICGEKMYLRTTRTPLYDGDAIVGMITSAMEVTDFAKQDFYFNSMISRLPLFIYWKDENSRFLGGNDNLARNAKLPSGDDLANKTDFDMTTKTKAYQIRENDLQIMESQKSKIFEETGKDESGRQLNVLSYKSPILDEQSESIGILGVSVDITERKRLEASLREAKEAAECANRAKSEFLACMSHDLKTPLNGILGISELLLMSEESTTEQKTMLRELNKSGTYLKQIIEDILMLAKLETDKLKLEKERFNLYRLATEVTTKLRFHANLNNVDLEICYDESLPVFLVGDKKRIKQVIMNLLSNAIKFTSGGCVLLAFDPIKETEDSIHIQISIEDTGIGIPDDQIDDVFKKFVQVEASYQSKYDGTGLGLFIVQSLVEGMGGNVGVNSQLGNGATFWCQIYVDKCPESNFLQDWSKNNADISVSIINNDCDAGKIIFSKLDGRNIKLVSPSSFTLTENKVLQIVFIDGNDTSTIPELWLKKKNMAVITYGSDTSTVQENHMGLHYNLAEGDKELLNVIEDASDMLKEFSESSLISSISKENVNILMVEDDCTNQKIQSSFLSRMGFSCKIADCGTTAVELCRQNDYNLVFMDLGLPDMSGYELIKRVRKYIHGPVIALTAHSTDKDKKTCLDAGMDDFLSKPLSFNQLQEIINKWICS